MNKGGVVQLVNSVGNCNSVLLGDCQVHCRNAPRITPQQEGEEAGEFVYHQLSFVMG